MMDQQPVEAPKPKQTRQRPCFRGCLYLLLIPIVLVAACYGGMWVFARYGGDWATSDPFSVPTGSEPIDLDLVEMPYTNDTLGYHLYRHDWTPDELRGWFEQEGFKFYPQCSEVPKEKGPTRCYQKGPASRGEKYVTNTRLKLYGMSALFTVIIPRVDTTDWQTIPVSKVMVSIYKDQAEFDAIHFYPQPSTVGPTISIPEGKTVFRIVTVAAQKLEWWLFPTYERPGDGI